MKLIQPVVEGHSEEEALPVLLRRLCEEASAWAVKIGSPIRRPRNKLASEHGVMQAVAIARRQPACEAILIAFDGDRDCPAELGPKVRGWAAAAAGGLPCEVVLPHREYEAWFLAAIESLRTHDLIRTNAESHPNPEQPRGAKEQLKERLAAAGYIRRGSTKPHLARRSRWNSPIADPDRSGSSRPRSVLC